MRVIRYFLWIVVLVVGLIVWKAFGLPHFIWSYQFLDNGNRYDPFLERHYTSCTFWGPYGMFTEPAQNGNCGYFAFFKREAS